MSSNGDEGEQRESDSGVDGGSTSPNRVLDSCLHIARVVSR